MCDEYFRQSLAEDYFLFLRQSQCAKLFQRMTNLIATSQLCFQQHQSQSWVMSASKQRTS